MSKKTYVLDTNVLLADPNALFAFEEHEVVLPFTVLEELDRNKSRQDEVGANARGAGRHLHNLIKTSAKKQTLQKGVSLPNNGILKVISSSDFEVELKSDLGQDLADNHILAVALGLSKSTPNKLTVLVTNDVLLRVKADACGLASEEYRKYNVAGTADSLYPGFREVVVTGEQMADFWANKNDPGYLAYAIEKVVGVCSPNEFIQIRDCTSKKPFIVRCLGDAAKFVPEHFELPKVKPRNQEQRLLLDLLMDKNVNLVTCTGLAGSGKTLLSLAAGLEQVLEKRKYETLLVCRPVQPLGKDIGFLPGTKEEKMEPWISPIKDNLRFLLTNGNGKKSKNSENTLNYYFEHGIIEVEAMTYIRGRSISNAYMIIDEAQNLSAHELKTIITRVGEGTKIVLTGDIEQIDNMYVDSVSNGLAIAVEKFKKEEVAGHVSLVHGERSVLATIAAKIL